MLFLVAQIWQYINPMLLLMLPKTIDVRDLQSPLENMILPIHEGDCSHI